MPDSSRTTTGGPSTSGPTGSAEPGSRSADGFGSEGPDHTVPHRPGSNGTAPPVEPAAAKDSVGHRPTSDISAPAGDALSSLASLRASGSSGSPPAADPTSSVGTPASAPSSTDAAEGTHPAHAISQPPPSEPASSSAGPDDSYAPAPTGGGPPAAETGWDGAGQAESSGPAQTVAEQGLFEPVTAGSPPPLVPQDGTEAPEEQLDPTAVRIVAELDDEVLVVDEQPRYHLAGCRAVLVAAIIPLSAREAIELGFTPCGWCKPDAALAGRHRADVRH